MLRIHDSRIIVGAATSISEEKSSIVASALVSSANGVTIPCIIMSNSLLDHTTCTFIVATLL